MEQRIDTTVERLEELSIHPKLVRKHLQPQERPHGTIKCNYSRLGCLHPLR